jgi:hypothetical protein
MSSFDEWTSGGHVRFASNDDELDDALAAAETGDMIRLGGEVGSRVATGAIRGEDYEEAFTEDRTITTEGLHFKGQLGSGPGSRINAEWTIEEQFRLEGIYLRGKYTEERSEWNFNDRGQILHCRASQTHLRLNGHQVLISGLYDASGITIDAPECVITGGLLAKNVSDNGTRTVIEGWGTNEGNPTAGEGQWAGRSTYAYNTGATILDTVGGDVYVPFPPEGAHDWVRLEGTVDPTHPG